MWKKFDKICKKIGECLGVSYRSRMFTFGLGDGLGIVDDSIRKHMEERREVALKAIDGAKYE